MNAIEVSNLHFRYPHVPVLCNVSFEVQKGSFLAIAGPNEAGNLEFLSSI